MVSGTDGDSGYLGQLANPSTDGPRLHDPRLSVEHVEQVPGYADQIPFRRTTQQPKPLLPVVKVRRDENFHALVFKQKWLRVSTTSYRNISIPRKSRLAGGIADRKKAFRQK
jgi:hypothetical protein